MTSEDLISLSVILFAAFLVGLWLILELSEEKEAEDKANSERLRLTETINNLNNLTTDDILFMKQQGFDVEKVKKDCLIELIKGTETRI